jgi:hypothetical protein
MAAPTRQAVGTINAIINGTAAITPVLPAFAADDVAIALVTRRTTTLTISSVTAGWTAIAGPVSSVAERTYIYGRRLAGGDGNPTFTWSGTGGDQYAQIITARGCNTSATPWEVVGAGQVGTGNNPSLTGITTLSNETLVMICLAYFDDNNTAFDFTATSPATFTEDYAESTIGADGSLCFGTGAQATAGATGTIATTGLTVTAGDGWSAVVLGLIPPAAGGATHSLPYSRDTMRSALILR